MTCGVRIIGGGIIGLSTAIKFGEMGHNVHVLQSDDYFYPTSPVAAAFWYPYACAMTPYEEKLLAGSTYTFLRNCAKDADSGVQIRDGIEYFDDSVSGFERLPPWWASLKGIDFRLLQGDEIPVHLRDNKIIGPFVYGWSFRVPVINMSKFLDWLRIRAKGCGVTFEVLSVPSIESQFSETDVVLNCTGGWATWLVDDSLLVGVQGVVLELTGEPAGDKLIFIEKGRSEGLPTYIVPQVSRTILGGTLFPKTAAGSKWTPGDLELWTPDDKDVNSVVQRCRSIINTSLDGLEIQSAAGLRPRRSDSPPRIEKVEINDKLLIHNYGHGGSGVTTCWGSAEFAYSLFEQWQK